MNIRNTITDNNDNLNNNNKKNRITKAIKQKDKQSDLGKGKKNRESYISF